MLKEAIQRHKGTAQPSDTELIQRLLDNPEFLASIVRTIVPEVAKIQRGDKGDPGESIKGEQGEKGDPGESIQGERGPEGPQGLPGPEGPAGKDGNDGKDGKDGKDGVAGKDGSPDTPAQVRDKLVSLKGDERLPASAIKGLDNDVALIRREIREVASRQGGGGGMGNVQHESKSVSSVTTSIQTSYKIAGGGYAIWAYYNGQLIMRGTHYTVNSDQRTLPLTFTPDDSTTIDLIYIRT